MDELGLFKFKEILLNLKKELLTTDTNIEDLQGEKVGDEADMANNDSVTSLATKMITRNNSYLKRINLSLKKIEDGTYGNCESCDEQINERRLLARPTALLCVDCKEEQEREEQKEKEKLKGGFLADWD